MYSIAGGVMLGQHEKYQLSQLVIRKKSYLE